METATGCQQLHSNFIGRTHQPWRVERGFPLVLLAMFTCLFLVNTAKPTFAGCTSTFLWLPRNHVTYLHNSTQFDVDVTSPHARLRPFKCIIWVHFSSFESAVSCQVVRRHRSTFATSLGSKSCEDRWRVLDLAGELWYVLNRCLGAFQMHPVFHPCF